jgi:hypothetical protein
MSSAEQDPNQLPGMNVNETQSRSDGDAPQSRLASSGAGSANSNPVAGNNVVGNTTGRGDVVGGNKSGHNISFGGLTAIAIVAIVLFFIGKFVVQSSGEPSASDLTQQSTCADYLAIEDPSARLAVINRIATEIGHRGVIGSPILLSEVDVNCGKSKNGSLGDAVGRARGY